MSEHELVYRLALTEVTIAGTVTVVTNPRVSADPVTSRTSTISVVVGPDPARTWTLSLPRPDGAKATASVTLHPDGRLVSADATVDDQRGERLQSLIKIATSAAYVLGPLAVGLVNPVAAPVALAAAFSSTLARASLPLRAHEAEAPDPTDLGVHPAYVTGEHARPADAALLARLRWAERRIVSQVADLATADLNDPVDTATRVRALRRTLGVVRDRLAEAETAYLRWINEGAEAARVETVHERFRLSQLPSENDLRTWTAGAGTGAKPAWWSVLQKLRVMVTCDFVDVDPSEDANDETIGIADDYNTEHVVYRRSRLATLVTWTAEPGDGETFKVAEKSREQKVVLVRGTETSAPLRPYRRTAFRGDRPDGDSQTTIEFDAEGFVKTVKSVRTDSSVERAAALATIPAELKSGKELATALQAPSPAETRLAEKKADLELLEVESKLDELRAPAPIDALAQLRRNVEKAELEARLVQAQTVSSGRTHQLVQIRIVD